MYVRTYVCMYVRMYVCVCYIYIYVSMNIQTIQGIERLAFGSHVFRPSDRGPAVLCSKVAEYNRRRLGSNTLNRRSLKKHFRSLNAMS